MTISYVINDSLYLNVTNRCPNHCDFCIRNTADSFGGVDPLWLEREPTVDELIDELTSRRLSQSQYGELVFCGFGEPLERLDDVLEVCRWVRIHSSIPIRINTNGLADLIHGKKTAPLMEGLVDVLSISMNAATPEKYQERCHSQFGLDALPAIHEFAEEALKYVPSVVMTVVDTMPEEEIEECRQQAQEIGARFRVRRYSPS